MTLAKTLRSGSVSNGVTGGERQQYRLPEPHGTIFHQLVRPFSRSRSSAVSASSTAQRRSFAMVVTGFLASFARSRHFRAIDRNFMGSRGRSSLREGR